LPDCTAAPSNRDLRLAAVARHIRNGLRMFFRPLRLTWSFLPDRGLLYRLLSSGPRASKREV